MSHLYYFIILGIYRAPLAVSRRIYLDESQDLTKIIYSSLKDSELILFWTSCYQPWLRYQVHTDGNRPYLDVVMIGAVKDITDKVHPLPNIDLSVMNKKSIQKVYRKLSRRRLQDTLDIFVLDYLNVNWDRRVILNWIKSGNRMIAFDNGNSYYFKGSYHYLEKTCPFLLHCPLLICPVQNLQLDCLKNRPRLNCRFHALTAYSLYNLDSRHPNDTEHVKSIEVRNVLYNLIGLSGRRNLDTGTINAEGLIKDNMASTLGEKLKHVLKTEPIPENYESYFGSFNLFEALDARLNYLLHYIETCHDMYGDKVFI